MGYLEMVAALKQLIYGASRPYTRVESRFSSHTGRIVSAISHRWVIMRKGQCIPLEPLYRSPKMSFWKIFSLGQLLRSTDPEDIATIYTYDALGRLTRRVHPDAGATHYSYDPAGNLIAEENPLGQIFYDYTYYRLAGKRYGNMSGNDVIYEYGTEGTATGLPVRINDGSGVLTLEYDAMGNVSKSVRVSSVPTSGIAFAFTHSFLYDSWGRMLQMTYPDGESVHYEYNRAGDLLRMYGEKNNHSRIYIDDIGYNKYGQRTHVDYGNGARTEYSYDPLRRLDRLRSRDAHNRILQEIGYSYDRVSNITQTRNTASVIDGMGGAFENNYVYDGLDRLVYAFGDSREGHAVDYKLDEMRYSASGRVGSKIQWWSTEAGHGAQHLVYGYVASGEKPHAPRLIADHATDSRYGLQWDPAGNLIQVIAHGDAPAFAARFHYWTEDNRLHTVADDRSYSYYAYDHTGQRVLKLTGASDQLDINADFLRTHTVLTEPTLYPSPYIVLSNHGYTKHYYAGSERVAARIGGGNLDHDTACIVADEEATERADRLFDWCLRQVKETAIAPLDLSSLDIRTIDGDRMDAPWWLDEAPAGLEAGLKLNVWKLLHAMDLLSSPSTVPPDTDDEPDVYFYHSDHLGSASWITEAGGKPVQHIQYLPYGEPFVNQRVSGYNERFTFTGKERDEETGYSYFGARYMDHELMTMWLSVDPLSDKYPSISPYNYCLWNPVKLVDPDGRDVWEVDENGYVKRTGDDGGTKKQTVKYANGNTATFRGARYHKVMSDLSTADANDVSSSYGGENMQSAYANVFKSMADNTNVEWAMHRYKDNHYALGTKHNETLSPDSFNMSKGRQNDKTLVALIHSHPMLGRPTTIAEQISSMGYLYSIDKIDGDAKNKVYNIPHVSYYTYFPRTKQLWSVGYYRPAYIRNIGSAADFFFGTFNTK